MITAALQAYLGNTPGVVTVTPDGEDYTLELDISPFIAKADPAQLQASISPIELTLTDLGGGKWQADQDQAFEFSFKSGDTVDVSGKIANLKSTGTFDEALGVFATSTTDASGFEFHEMVASAGQPPVNVEYHIDAMHYETALQADGADTVGGTSHMTMGALTEKFNIPGGPGNPPMDFVITGSGSSSDVTLAGLKAKPVQALVAFLVEHPSQELMAKDQQAFKDMLRTALPVFNTINMTGSIDNVKVATMLGEFGATKLSAEVGLTGAVKDAKFREKISVDGLATPAALVPPWAADLVPTSLSLDLNFSGFDFAAPAALILDKLDFSKDPPLPPDMDPELAKAVLPNGTMTFALGPSTVVDKIAKLGLEGSMDINPAAAESGAPPTGQAKISLEGFDALLAALQAVPPEMGLGQVIPVMMMAKGMSKSGDNGALIWEIESTQPGSVTINGIDPTKM